MWSPITSLHQRLTHSRVPDKIEHALFRYGQLLIYFIAIALVGFAYLRMQEVLAKILADLGRAPVPQF